MNSGVKCMAKPIENRPGILEFEVQSIFHICFSRIILRCMEVLRLEENVFEKVMNKWKIEIQV
jgi:hypothetical protein